MLLARERSPTSQNFPFFLESFIFCNFLFVESYKVMYINFVYNFYVQTVLEYLFSEIVVREVLNKLLSITYPYNFLE